MKYVSLFAGIGGFDLALNRLGHQCVYVNEWDKYAAQTYEKNFGYKPDTRDITTVPATDIPNHDLLVGGFPCQSFSIAGKRRGFDDIRGTLFFDIARILQDKRPRHFILENVKGLLSHDEGKTFQTILGVLSDLGYEYQWQVLNSKNFGVPQNRERVFIVGHIRGTSRPKVFPITGESKKTVDSGELAGTLQADYFKGDRTGGYAIETQRYPLKFAKRNQKNIEGDYSFTVDGANTGGVMLKKIGSVGKDAQGNRIYDSKGISTTLQGLAGGRGAKTGLYQVENMQIRRLTPLECERLQGFPDGWTEGVSDTQRYKQLGNAVTVNVVEEIVRKLAPF